MKLATIALASGFALFSSFALAKTDRHHSAVRTHRGIVGMVQPHPNYGYPDGATTSSGAGKSYAVPGWSNEQTQYWLDNATGPKD
jgi:hypothetical protein